MPSISGSFSGKITQQFGLPLNDQSNHLERVGGEGFTAASARIDIVSLKATRPPQTTRK